jgi:hypothetical protein
MSEFWVGRLCQGNLTLQKKQISPMDAPFKATFTFCDTRLRYSVQLKIFRETQIFAI